MAKEKVYRVTVVIDVYGETSKDAALGLVLEGMVDGLIVESHGKVELLKDKEK